MMLYRIIYTLKDGKANFLPTAAEGNHTCFHNTRISHLGVPLSVQLLDAIQPCGLSSYNLEFPLISSYGFRRFLVPVR